MSHLKSLAVVAVPRRANADPRLARRQRLIERLGEQQRLAADPSYVGRFTRRQKQPDGTRATVEYERRPAAWWVTDPSGQVVMTLRAGYRLLEIEKGKSGIAVGAKNRLDAVIATLIEATRAGELDAQLEATANLNKPRGKKSAG